MSSNLTHADMRVPDLERRLKAIEDQVRTLPEIAEAVQKDGCRGLFTMSFQDLVSPEAWHRIQTIWRDLWERSGVAPPSLLILDGGVKLSAVSEAELKKHGWVREQIPLQE